MQILAPTPAFSAAGRGTVSGRGWDSYIAPAVLSVASPKYRGTGEDHPRLEFSSGQNVAVTTTARKSATGAQKGKRDRSNDWKTRQLWVDAVTYGHIQELVASIEAKGPSELVRRALRAREVYHLEDDGFAETVTVLQANQDERLNITLPPQSWERVERLKANTGKSFRTLVYEAILVFAELHERSKEADEGGAVHLY